MKYLDMEVIKWLTGSIVLLFSVLVLTFGLIYQVGKFSCNKLETNTGIETKYSYFGGGCLVKVNNRFIPQENWRGEYQQ